MAARIRSTILAADVDELSRDDAVLGSIVTLVSIDAATTYAWSITFAPKGSTATFTGSATAISPGTFTVDKDGPYLIRLTIDASLPSEDTQYVRIRALTAFGGLTLVAAGERRDGTGIIPVDVDTEGWANEQNANISTLLAFVQPLVSSGRVLYVDANDSTAGYGDHDTVQAAINAAVVATPSATAQWVVLVRPGTYVENLAFADFVHVIGWPGNPDGTSSKAVVLEGFHTAAPSASATTLLANLHLEQNTNSTTATLIKSGAGTLSLFDTRVESNGTDAAQGPAVEVSAGIFDAVKSYLFQNVANVATTYSFSQSAASTVLLNTCTLLGPSGAIVNDLATPVIGVFCTMTNCLVTSVHANGIGVATTAESLTVDRCVINAASNNSILVNAAGAAFAGNVDLTVRFSDMGGKDIQYETFGLLGTNTLNLGSVIYRDLVYPTATPTEVALTKSFSHFYDNTVSGLAAKNVQDAIDEVAFGGGPNDSHQFKATVSPANTINALFFAPYNLTVVAVNVYAETIPVTAGVYTFAVTDLDAAKNLLAAATLDMTALVAATLTSASLTGTVADLDLPTGTKVQFQLVSDNGDLTATDVYIQILFRSQ